MFVAFTGLGALVRTYGGRFEADKVAAIILVISAGALASAASPRSSWIARSLATVQAFYVRRAAKEGVMGAKTGGVTAVQRASSDMRLNPHLLTIALDGAHGGAPLRVDVTSSGTIRPGDT
jgi:hypothetical protein